MWSLLAPSSLPWGPSKTTSFTCKLSHLFQDSRRKQGGENDEPVLFTKGQRKRNGTVVQLTAKIPLSVLTANMLHITAKMTSLVFWVLGFFPQNLDIDISKSSKLCKLEISSSYIVASLIPYNIFLSYIMLEETSNFIFFWPCFLIL